MVTFLHPSTREPMTGRVVGKQVQTGELDIERADDRSRVWVRPEDVKDA